MKITRNQKKEIARIAKKFQLKLVIVFGSFASGKNHKDSDLDIAIFGSDRIFFDAQIDLTNEFAVIFDRNIDLSLLNDANPLLLFQVSKNASLLFGSREEFLKFKLYAFKAYNDYLPYFKMENKLNKKIINSYAY